MAATRAPFTPFPRRSLFKVAAGILGGLASAIGWAAPRGEAAATKKIPQKTAQYQDTPKGSQHCAICSHFVQPASCQLVAGQISPHGWCLLFSPKPSKS